ncbi:hypothetical protein IAQ61_004606 [Plenodomus lingam]|uniref:uncharacterized protein n=1 Tax=Leptosphaeria maculans TaxID=5022 RepID=UPI0033245EC4|nr:hypothetical protein IAQ61_004606 [Plenodomus lingam]
MRSVTTRYSKPENACDLASGITAELEATHKTTAAFVVATPSSRSDQDYSPLQRSSEIYRGRRLKRARTTRTG